MKRDFSKLPNDVVPINYEIEIEPDLCRFTFKGKVIINIKIQKPTTKIVINLDEINISFVNLKINDKEYTNDQIIVSYSKEEEIVTFELADLNQLGEGVLEIHYDGILNDRMKGFYRSAYKTPNGEIRYGASTQFEATEARRAFPCWDEPALKATFDITLVVPANRVVLSNMPETSRKAMENGLTSVRFARSPLMSTYLVAFVVGEYDYVEKTDADGVIVRVYTPVDRKEQGLFALDVAVSTLPFYQNYFGIKYPLPKMDLIAIADFAGGAMENWGLITYRETALLIDPSDSSTSAKQTVALVVGHEIAHMWFGNLVTMEWWTDLWLKEGFATWIEYLCVDFCYPEFDIWTQFATSDLTRALELDSLNNSHPIEVAVGHPSEIDEIFDAISYSKGASIIRMLHSYVGDKAFQSGLKTYLAKHMYKNTCTEDLWLAIEEASGYPISLIMNTWTKQMGFPLIQVSKTKGENETIINIKQSKFTADGSKSLKQSWSVPISICSQKSPDTSILNFIFDTEEKRISLDNSQIGDWMKINVGGTGFYRTLYDKEWMLELMEGIRRMQMGPRDRLAIQDDIFALTRSGELNALETLRMSKAFQNETNFTVWSDLAKNISFLSHLYQYSDFNDAFNNFKVALFQPVFCRIGWNTLPQEGPLTSMLRALVIGQLGMSGDYSVIDEARRKFKEHCQDGHKIPADLRYAIYRIVLKNGGMAEYDHLMTLYEKASMQEERMRIIRSLGSSSDSNILSKALAFAISTQVRSQDTVALICGCMGSVQGRKQTWDFIKSNWSVFQSRYRGGFLLSRLVKTSTEMFASEEMAVDIEEFFKSNPVPAAERTILQSLENIRINCNQLARDSNNLAYFFKTA